MLIYVLLDWDVNPVIITQDMLFDSIKSQNTAKTVSLSISDLLCCLLWSFLLFLFSDM